MTLDDYTPSTGRVLDAWCAWRGSAYHFTVGDDGAVGGPAAEFDRWLAQERAKAWDEGFAYAEHNYSDKNPYRKDTL